MSFRPADNTCDHCVVTNAGARGDLSTESTALGGVTCEEVLTIRAYRAPTRTQGTSLDWAGRAMRRPRAGCLRWRRWGFNGLHGAITERLGEDPKWGALFVFSNRWHIPKTPRQSLNLSQPSHCGFWEVPSNCVDVLNRSYWPDPAASEVRLSNAATCSLVIALKVAAASIA